MFSILIQISRIFVYYMAAVLLRRLEMILQVLLVLLAWWQDHALLFRYCIWAEKVQIIVFGFVTREIRSVEELDGAVNAKSNAVLHICLTQTNVMVGTCQVMEHIHI
jgi:hypothetical protein